MVPHERLRWTDRFEDPNLPGEMKVAVGSKKVSVRTEVRIVQLLAFLVHWSETERVLAKLRPHIQIPDGIVLSRR